MRFPLLALLAALAWMWTLPAQAQQLSLGTLSNYLNQLQSAEGSFTQINADGTISTGTVYIRRPGKVRFEYDPPEEALVLAGSNTVAIYDGKSNTGPATYPLSQTPLSIILARNVDLGRASMVTGHHSDGKTTTVRAQDPENPQYGNIQLVFSGPPVELRQWVITDDTGTETTVILGALETGNALSDTLFNIEQENAKYRFDR